MKIRGALVDILIDISPETYLEYVTYENESKVTYVTMVKALYGMMQASIIKSLEAISKE